MVARVLCAVAGVISFTATAFGGIELQPKAGAPIQGLTPEETDRFWIGRGEFSHIFTVDEGLGPGFTGTGCGACHGAPLGGWGVVVVTRFGHLDENGFDPLTHLGGPVHQLHGISKSCQEWLPPPEIANLITQRLTNSSLAAGLVEAIPDAALLAHADPLDRDGDGVSGRARFVPVLEECIPTPTGPDCTDAPLRVGRFGWKAQLATVLSFSADAAQTEMGLTNRIFPVEHAPNGDFELLALCDSVSDPEDGPDDKGFDFIDRVTDFQRFLGVPPQTPRFGMTGEALFTAIGCATCHVAEWTTADDPALEPALREKTFRPYSDFLLHDMGLLGDGFPEGDVEGNEMRTPSLWNLARRDPMLHDGRAVGETFFDRVAGPGGAIWWHNVAGSEAQGAASAYFALSEPERLEVIAFLQSLGRLEFDADRNRIINLVDFADFKACFDASGGNGSPGIPPVTPDDECAVHDIDQNGIVDAADFAWFLVAFEGNNGDCDGDGISDLEAILLGAPDVDGDGVPDDCLGSSCSADLDRDGAVSAGDLGALLAAWGSADSTADLNSDGLVDDADLAVLLGQWGVCPGV